MADTTAIEWCDSTFNPWIGCTRVSPACDDCYAARSTPARTLGVAWGAGKDRRLTSKPTWKLPIVWQRQAAAFQAQHGRRRRVFCASLADWLDNEVPIQWLVDLLELVRTTPDLDWLLLTKRIGNWSSRISEAIGYLDEQTPTAYPLPLRRWLCQWLDGDEAPRNVWLGSTVVNQAEVQRDAPKLLATPAAVRFLSVEPMLGPVSLDAMRYGPPCTGCGEAVHLDAFTGSTSCIYACDGPKFDGIDWVICGGESGPKARPMHPDWARSLRDQCAAAGVPFLFKQWGEWAEFDADGLPGTRIAMEGDPEFEDQAAQCAAFISLDGVVVHSMREVGRREMPYRGLIRPGKKAAGRQLDGRTHDAWPVSAT